MFTLTSAAARQIQQAANASGAQDMALRIAARIDMDGSMQYGMGFDDAKDEDMKLDLDSVAVVIADDAQELLVDTVLDYVELKPGEFNFIFVDGQRAQGGSAQASGRGCSSAGYGGGACNSGGCSGGACAGTGGSQ